MACKHKSLILSVFSLLLISGMIIAGGASVLAPNMSSCQLPQHFPSGQEPYDCCAPPAYYEPRLFRPTGGGSLLRVRRPAHAADDAYSAKLARAYTLMKALPADDPRSFSQQANIHCAYCNNVYRQMNSTQPFQVHNTWLFFPFHRWYIYFHERILARLLGDDPNFALAFWNYDHPDGASIPWLFSINSSAVHPVLSAGVLRDSNHEYPATVALDYGVDTDIRPRPVQLQENDNTMYRALIRDAHDRAAFFGWPYRQDDPPMEGFGFGTIEWQPHNTIHSWVGNKSAIGWQHMGALFSSGHDPLFYSHHAEIDRFWELWKALPDHEDFDDEDYQNAEFLFYNEDAELVRVRAGDASNTSLLGYVYEEVETPWVGAVPEKRSLAPATLGADDTVCIIGEWIESTPCSFIVERDPEVSKASPSLHDHLVLTMLYNDTLMRLDVYLNFPSANATTNTGCKEYVTEISYTHFTFVGDDTEIGNNTVRLDISERLVDLNLTEESRIVVTLVPRLPDLSIFPAQGNTVLLSAFVEYAIPYQRWDGMSAYI
ncbi:hypothetical protein GOP47_0014160 [Adiantum capillus-veneris]|uniref:Tyrosinase copper-binding domain-containing protein n=1 Tax=Adiantum capillus-veneris TaxID=13818 RepID=A0A9D4UQE7_ADICA|nr:hypothetical protein GOP47_0014160 [Adiantum capillus-veneris]